jgi:hypothetical protein
MYPRAGRLYRDGYGGLLSSASPVTKLPPPDLSHLDDLSVDELWVKIAEWCASKGVQPTKTQAASSPRCVPSVGTYTTTYTELSSCQECEAEVSTLTVYSFGTGPEYMSSVLALCVDCGGRWTRIVRKRLKAALAT